MFTVYPGAIGNEVSARVGPEAVRPAHYALAGLGQGEGDGLGPHRGGGERSAPLKSRIGGTGGFHWFRGRRQLGIVITIRSECSSTSSRKRDRRQPGTLIGMARNGHQLRRNTQPDSHSIWACCQLPTRLNRPIFTRFSAVGRRVTQDPAGPFCTMKVQMARDFCDNWSLNLRGLPRRRFLGTLR